LWAQLPFPAFSIPVFTSVTTTRVLIGILNILSYPSVVSVLVFVLFCQPLWRVSTFLATFAKTKSRPWEVSKVMRNNAVSTYWSPWHCIHWHVHWHSCNNWTVVCPSKNDMFHLGTKTFDAWHHLISQVQEEVWSYQPKSKCSTDRRCSH
jgi:hypothetical protein